MNHDATNAAIKAEGPLHRELWTSWASCLRAYSAMYGMNSIHHAVVEVSADEILLRVDTRWVRFTASESERSGSSTKPFALRDDGSVLLEGTVDAMDLSAERMARAMLTD